MLDIHDLHMGPLYCSYVLCVVLHWPGATRKHDEDCCEQKLHATILIKTRVKSNFLNRFDKMIFFLTQY